MLYQIERASLFSEQNSLRVQGAESAESIAFAIRRTSGLAAALGLDLMIVARGGGSLEDLWGFNDERVARAIVDSVIPVVSAVGHETDYTIADFVSDRRAPTPSAAAELVFPRLDELVLGLTTQRARLERSVRRDLQHRRTSLRAAATMLGDGRGLIATHRQRLGFAQAEIERGLQRFLAVHRQKLHALETHLARLHPRVRLHRVQSALASAEGRIAMALRQQLVRRHDRLDSYTEQLTALSPLAVLARGYSIVLGPGAQAVRDATAVKVGDHLDIRVAKGRLDAVVDHVDKPQE